MFVAEIICEIKKWQFTKSFKLDLCAAKIFIAYPYNRFEHTIELWTVMFRRLLQSLLNGAIYIL